MCHKLTSITRNNQSGFLIPVAAFLLVVISVLAATLMRTSSQAGLASTQELISIQAFYSAESGAQSGMARLFINNDPRTGANGVDAHCAAMVSPPVFSATGLSNCSATVSCSCVDEAGAACSAAAVYSFYTISSVGICGTGAVTSSRTVQVSAFMQ